VNCAVAGCGGNAHRSAKGASGYCNKHFKRWRRHGDPLGGRTPNGEKLKWLVAHQNYDGQDCLIWPFPRHGDGYARLYHNGKVRIASRLMCELAHGQPPTPADLFDAAHGCGRGADGCVNPRHLRWATCSENNMDKHAHGTLLKGETSLRSKLSETDVLSIRARATSVSQRRLAEEFDVDQSQISRIVRRVDWAWLHPPNTTQRSAAPPL